MANSIPSAGDPSAVASDPSAGGYSDYSFIGGSSYTGPKPDPNQDWVYGGATAHGTGFARYYDGQQFEPYNWDDGAISGLQQSLVAAGFLNPKSMVPGVWDPASASAYEKAMAYANMNGVSVGDLLAKLANGADAAGLNRGGGGGGGGGGLGAAPVTDDDIRALANKTAQGVLGRNLRDDEIANFIPAFRGTIATGTTGATAATDILRQQTAPTEAQGHDVGNVLQVFNNLLSTGGMK